jgi:tryptophanyl-tRNA synthetase
MSNLECNVTPWAVTGNIDYTKLVSQFGTELIDHKLIEKFERVTGKPVHPWIRRGIFFSHRELNQLLDNYAAGKKMFLYTGRGPSSDSMHIGHMVPFMFTKWLQDVFDCVLVIQISDDEKYAFKDITFNEVYKLGFKNSKDIIAFGFNPAKTFIFSNRDYRLSEAGRVYEILVSDMKKLVSAKKIAKIFGFGKQVQTVGTNGEIEEHYIYDESVNVAMIDWPLYQSAAAFSQAFPHLFGNDQDVDCLVAYAIDQDPYFRLCRDIASELKLKKPRSIMSTFIPPLIGTDGKMSSSIDSNSTLFLTDKEQTTRDKIKKYSFSGSRGDGSKQDHERLGGDTSKDIAYQYLRYFEYDDTELERIRVEFSSGRMLCSEIKKIMADKICALIKNHQDKRSLVTDEVLEEFYRIK